MFRNLIICIRSISSSVGISLVWRCWDVTRVTLDIVTGLLGDTTLVQHIMSPIINLMGYTEELKCL